MKLSVVLAISLGALCVLVAQSSAATCFASAPMYAKSGFTKLNLADNGTIAVSVGGTSSFACSNFTLTISVSANGGTVKVGSSASSVSKSHSISYYGSTSAGDNSQTFYVVSSSSASHAVTLSYSVDSTDVTAPEDSVFVVVEARQVKDSLPNKLFTNQQEVVSVALGTPILSPLILTLDVQLSGAAGLGSSQSVAQLVFPSGRDVASWTLNTGSTAGALSVSYVPVQCTTQACSGKDGSTQYPETFVNSPATTVSLQETITHNVPSLMFIGGMFAANMTLGGAAKKAFNVTIVATGTGSGGSPASIAFAAGDMFQPFNISANATVAGLMTLAFTISGDGASQFHEPSDYSVTVAETTVGSSFLVNPDGSTEAITGEGEAYTNQMAVFRYDAGAAIPAGLDLNVTISINNGYIILKNGSMVMEWTFTILENLRSFPFGLKMPSSTGTSNVTYMIAGGSAAEGFSAPANLNITVNAQDTITIDDTAINAVNTYTSSSSEVINITLSAAAEEDFTVKMAIEGDAATGASLCCGTLDDAGVQTLMFLQGDMWQTFQVLTGPLAGDVEIEYEVNTPQFEAPDDTDINIDNRKDIADNITDTAITAGESTIVMVALEDTVDTDTELTITLMADMAWVQPEYVTFSVNQTTATFTVTPGANSGFVTLSSARSGTAKSQFSSWVNALVIPILTSTGIVFNAPRILSAGATSETVTCTLGTALPSGASLVIIPSVSSASGPEATFTPNTLSFTTGESTATFTIEVGTNPGNLTINYVVSLSGSSVDYPTTGLASWLSVDQLGTVTIHGPTSVLVDENVTFSLSVAPSVPADEVLVITPVLSGDVSASNSTSPAQLAFGSLVSTASFEVQGANRTGRMNMAFVLSGTAATRYARPSFPGLSILSTIDHDTPPTMFANDMAMVTVTIGYPVAAGESLFIALAAHNLGATLSVDFLDFTSSTTQSFMIYSDNVVGDLFIDAVVLGSLSTSYILTRDFGIRIMTTMDIAPTLPSIIPTNSEIGPLTMSIGSAIPYALVLNVVPEFSGVVTSANDGFGVSGALNFDSNTANTHADFTFTTGALVGSWQIDWHLHSSAAPFYTLPPSMSVIVQAGITTEKPICLTTGGSKGVVTVTLDAPVPTSGDLTVDVAASIQSSLSKSSLTFAAGDTSKTFRITTSATSGVCSLTYTLSGTSMDLFKAPQPPTSSADSDEEIIIFVRPGEAVGHAARSDVFEGEWILNFLGFGDVVSGGDLDITINTGTAFTIDTNPTIPSGSQCAVYTIQASTSTRRSTQPMSLRATSNSVTMSASGTAVTSGAFSVPTLPVHTVSTTPKAVLTFTNLPTTQEIGQTSANITISFTSAIPTGGDLTVAVALNSSSPAGSKVNAAPVTFAAGATSGSFSVSTAYVSGTIQLDYTLTGTSAAGYATPAQSAITVVYPSTTTFTVANISESTSVVGALNTYTIKFLVTRPLYKGDTMTISGLNAAVAGNEVIFVTSPNFEFVSNAKWTASSVVLTVNATIILPSAPLTISFPLTNPSTAQTSADAKVSIASSTFSLTDVALNNGTMVSLAGTANNNAFTSLSATEASQINGGDNIITIKMKLNVDLVAPSYVTITGFQGFQTKSTSSLALSGASASSFGSKAQWQVSSYDAASGVSNFTLIAALQTTLQTSTVAAELKIRVQNPAAAATANSLKAVITGSTPVTSMTVTGGVGGAGTAPTATFSAHTIAESSAVQAASNNLTLTFQTSIALNPLDSVSCTGLAASQTPTSWLTLLGSSAAIFGGKGYFDASSGTLLLTVAANQQLAASTLATLIFTVKNPKVQQTDVTKVMLSAAGVSPITASEVSYPSGAVLMATTIEPLSFTFAYANESSTVLSAENSLSFCFGVTRALMSTTSPLATTKVVFTNFPATGSSTNAALVISTTSGTVTLSSANYDSSNSKLTLTIPAGSEIGPTQPFCFATVLKNPATASSSSSSILVSAVQTMDNGDGSGQQNSTNSAADYSVEGSVLQANGGSSLAFTTTTAIQSSAVQGQSNQVTFTLTPNADLDSSTTIIFNNMTGINDPSDGQIALVGGEAFGGYGTWNRQAGTLTLEVQTLLRASKSFSISFTMQNPVRYDSTRANINVKAMQASTEIIPNTKLVAQPASTTPLSAGYAIFAAPFKGWYERSFYQESVSCSFCPIYVRLRPTEDVASGKIITVAGLLTSSTGDNAALAIDDTTNNEAGSGILGSTGAWTQSTGTLLLTLGSAWSHTKTLSFTIKTLSVPATPQSSGPTVTVGVAGAGNIASTTVDVATIEAFSSTVFLSAVAPQLSEVAPRAGTLRSTEKEFTLGFDSDVELTGTGTVTWFKWDGVTKTQVHEVNPCKESDELSSFDRNVRISIPSTLQADTTGSKFFASISAGCIKNSANQGGLGFAGVFDANTISFYSPGGNSPVIEELSPSHQSRSMLPGTTSIGIKFTSTVEAVEGFSVNIVKEADNSAIALITFGAIAATDSSFGLVSGLWANFTVPASAFPNSAECYYVEIPAGAIRSSVSGLPFSGTSRFSWRFCTPTLVGPRLLSTMPIDNAVGVGQSTQSLTMTFDQQYPVGKGNGTVRLFARGSTEGSLADIQCQDLTISPTDNSIQAALPITGNNFAAFEPHTTGRCFFVLVSSDCVCINTDGNGTCTGANDQFYPGIQSTSGWDFCISGGARPNANQQPLLNPADNSVSVPTTTQKFEITFDQEVSRGTGFISLRRPSDSTLLQTVSVLSTASVTIAKTTFLGQPASKVTLMIPATLRANTIYCIKIPNGAFLSQSTGEAYAGMTTDTDWNFETAQHVEAFASYGDNSATQADVAGSMQCSRKTAGDCATVSWGASVLPIVSGGQRVRPALKLTHMAQGTPYTSTDPIAIESWAPLSKLYVMTPDGTTFTGNGILFNISYGTKYNSVDTASPAVVSGSRKFLKQTTGADGKPSWMAAPGLSPVDDKTAGTFQQQVTSFSNIVLASVHSGTPVSPALPGVPPSSPGSPSVVFISAASTATISATCLLICFASLLAALAM
eukprot:CAMPEP_0117004840 /NCGR_PEP_ID=MMETSP0472-20121206/5672_1 /TAXON_ID=693140 ORGANISM="Tiarina fusus, Strain LIS" /NCGR_SAMPLE_ID=MMETSP0472 /ASSEMBLY_ACC=CAM_ASM_000603 /LENGTH=3024 /DNA_ID=CAMNT_0004705915 /DNA_START=23 /DNA_END=9097 /DNA_ORIENTATION=+